MGAMGGKAPRVASAVKPERLAALTRLRLLLIGWVLIYHLELALHALDTLPWAEAVVMRGYLGVDGFFILSGFALFLGYRHRPPLGIAGWAEFVRRRAERVFPLHLAMLLALVAVIGVGVMAGFRVNDPQRIGAWDLLMQALLLHAWETTDTFAWNYPSWALSAIWAGYLVFPLLLTFAVTMRQGGAVLAGLLCLGGLWLLDTGQEGQGLNWTLHLGLVRFALEFVLGIALARLVTLRSVSASLSTTLAVILIPAGLALRLDIVVVTGLAALVARLGMEVPRQDAPRDLAWRLGEASFGIYLSWVFVEVVLVVLLRLFDPGMGGRLALMPLGLAASFALGWLAWRLVEVPAARLLARRA
jgi:peptidoglycan/LPS O-acetylase OafA/YrhL